MKEHLIQVVIAGVLSGLLVIPCGAKTNDWTKRFQRRKELAKIAEQQDPASIPQLIAALDEEADIAMWGLARFGPKASIALPRLLETNSHPAPRDYIANQLRRQVLERIGGCNPPGRTVASELFEGRDHRGYKTGLHGFQGDVSSIETPGVRLADNKESWRRLWIEHGGHASCLPRIDFKSEVVIAIFAGKTTWTEFIQVARFVQTPGGTTLQFDDMFSDALSDAPSSPYIFVRLPRSHLPIKVVQRKSWAMSSREPEERIVGEFASAK